jgi:uncharacterized protein (DUF1778 family)
MQTKKVVRREMTALSIRFEPEEISLIRAAALRRGMSINKFVARAAAAAGKAVLEAPADPRFDPIVSVSSEAAA